MKIRILFVLLMALIFSATASYAQTTPKDGKKDVAQTTPSIQWKATSIDMGKIPQGKPATATFEFTNAGTIPVVLKTVKPSCGCTTAGYTRAPVNQGQTGFVKATYNAAVVGKFTKSLDIIADDNETAILVIHGEVMPTASTPTGK